MSNVLYVFLLVRYIICYPDYIFMLGSYFLTCDSYAFSNLVCRPGSKAKSSWFKIYIQISRYYFMAATIFFMKVTFLIITLLWYSSSDWLDFENNPSDGRLALKVWSLLVILLFLIAKIQGVHNNARLFAKKKWTEVWFFWSFNQLEGWNFENLLL